MEEKWMQSSSLALNVIIIIIIIIISYACMVLVLTIPVRSIAQLCPDTSLDYLDNIDDDQPENSQEYYHH